MESSLLVLLVCFGNFVKADPPREVDVLAQAHCVSMLDDDRGRSRVAIAVQRDCDGYNSVQIHPKPLPLGMKIQKQFSLSPKCLISASKICVTGRSSCDQMHPGLR